MLTKTSNLEGLENLRQSQLNLGVIESLVGTVFNTDNCTVIENEHGVSFRNPRGLQLCMQKEARGFSIEQQASGYYYSSQNWNFPQPFALGRNLYAHAVFRTQGVITTSAPAALGAALAATFFCLYGQQRALANYDCQFIAFGFWKEPDVGQ